MTVTFELVNGLVFGLEHMDAEDNEDVAYLVVLHVACFRFCFIKFKA